MDFFQLTIISLIQGITEFLPISSSGHLVLLPAVTSFQDQGQLIDVAAHFGTLGAVIIYLWSDIFKMACATLTFGRSDKQGLLIFAGWLYHADKTAPDDRTIDMLSFGDAFKIGCAQILALIPGTSRSGVTMTMARQCGYSRLAAARFSMLMSVPVILGATILKARHFFTQGTDASLIQAGFVALLSLITALAAIRFMMGWLAQADFKIFVYYRLALGVILLGALATGMI